MRLRRILITIALCLLLVLPVSAHSTAIRSRSHRRRIGDELPTVEFDLNQTTFTPGMAKRTGPGPFAAAPIVQGAWDGTGTPDLLRFNVDSQITGDFFETFDYSQGSISFWVTPEWDADEAAPSERFLFSLAAGDGSIKLRKQGTNLRFYVYDQNFNASIIGWTAGSTHLVTLRWDINNPIDGTNYAVTSVDDVHTFGITAQPSLVRRPFFNIGSRYDNLTSVDAIIEGLHIYRRVLYDGAYGTDVGNGDELQQIHAAGVGADPTLVTGSWDVVFGLPTDSSTGALTSGTGEAWSHPHSSAVMDQSYMSDGYQGGNSYAVEYNAATTNVNAGSAAVLDNIPLADFTWDAWVRLDSTGENNAARLFEKEPFLILCQATTLLRVFIGHAGTNAIAEVPFPYDGKWHHLMVVWDQGTLTVEHFFLDGRDLIQNVVAGVGAYTGDAANDLHIGNRAATNRTLDGAMAWFRFSDNKRETSNFTPLRAFPAADGNTIEAWSFDEGTGATIAAQVDSPGNDGTLANGTWGALWSTVGTPTSINNTAAISTVQQLFGAGGYGWTADASGEGITQTVTGQDAGQDYVARIVTHADVTHTIRISDTTNGAFIVADFIVTPTTYVTRPAVSIFTWELPTIARNGAAADSTAFAVEILALGAGDVFVHQAEIQQQLIDNPSLETGAYELSQVTASNTYTITAGTIGGGTTITNTRAEDTVYWDIEETAGTPGTMIEMEFDLSNADSVAQTLVLVGRYEGNIGHNVDINLWDGAAWDDLGTWVHAGADHTQTINLTAAHTNDQRVVLQLDHTSPGNTNHDFFIDHFYVTEGPWIPDGWTNFNLDAGDTEPEASTVHSGVGAIQANAGVIGEGIVKFNAITPADTFFGLGGWGYLANAGSLALRGLNINDTFLQAGEDFSAGGGISIVSGAAWHHGAAVVRSATALGDYFVRPGMGAGNVSYADDFYMFALNDVSLTVTPASEANSAESGGLRVDGTDVVSQPTNGMVDADAFSFQRTWRPRHAAVNLVKFGAADAYYIHAWGDASNYVSVYASGANQLTLAFNDGDGAQTATWDATGLVVADTPYLMEARSDGDTTQLVIDGIVRATITDNVDFSTPLATVYWDNQQDGTSQGDSVSSPPQ